MTDEVLPAVWLDAIKLFQIINIVYENGLQQMHRVCKDEKVRETQIQTNKIFSENGSKVQDITTVSSWLIQQICYPVITTDGI